jgi:hypothetical protein
MEYNNRLNWNVVQLKRLPAFVRSWMFNRSTVYGGKVC